MTTLTSDATSIVVGQSITFNIVVPPQDIGQHLSAFQSAVAQFNSGDGQQVIDFFGPYGTGNFIIDGFVNYGNSVTFTYLTPGDYVASANGLIAYFAWSCGDLPSGVAGCGPFPFTAGEGSGSQNFALTENISVAAVPEPATWALLLLGFAILALRKTRAVKPQ